MKNYLKRHNLLKSGSKSPPDVIKKLSLVGRATFCGGGVAGCRRFGPGRSRGPCPRSATTHEFVVVIIKDRKKWAKKLVIIKNEKSLRKDESPPEKLVMIINEENRRKGGGAAIQGLTA